MDTNVKYTELLKSHIRDFKKETRSLEFKSNYQAPDKLGKYISALANGACLDHSDFGYLYFGVEDESLEITGTTFNISKVKAKGNQSLELYLRQYVSPKINFKIDEFHYEGKQRIVVFVIPAAVKEPVKFFEKPYIRVDSHVTELTPYVDWMREIYLSDIDWSAEPVERASLDWLDKEAIKKAREGYKERYPEFASESDGWADDVFLDRAKLTIDKKITRTTLLLVGKEEYAPFTGHIAQMVWKCYQDGQSFGEIFSTPFLLTTTKILNKIRNYRFKIYPDNSLIPAEVWKYDTKTILECMHNAVAHQSYSSDARIIVTETPDQLTFENSGGFFDGSYEDYILGQKTPKNYRNKALVQAMVNIKMIDTQGYGIHTMYMKQKERFLPLPDYSDSTPSCVILHLPGRVMDENYSKLLMEKTDMTLTTAIMLDMIQKGRGSLLSTEAIAELRQLGYIEGRRPIIYISKKIANISGQKAQYSRHKGLDMKKCESLLQDSMTDHGTMSKKEIEQLLWELLSDIMDDKKKHAKIHNFLTKLKKENKIGNTGMGPKTKWYWLK